MPKSDATLWSTPQLLRESLDLGNVARSKRVLAMVEASLAGSGVSIPRLFGVDQDGKSAAAKGAQRLLSNHKVEVARLRAALYGVTWAAVKRAQLRRVVVAFDPTYIAYNNHSDKKKKWVKGDGFEGYVGLSSAVIHPVAGTLLGVAHQALMTADGPDDRSWVDYAPQVEDPEKIAQLERASRQQFLIHAQEIDRTAPADVELVFVADREFDDGLALRALHASSPRTRFVIRSNEKRAVFVEPGTVVLPGNVRRPSKHAVISRSAVQSLEAVYIADLVRAMPMQSFGSIALDARGRVCAEGRKPARVAHLSVGTVRILLGKPSERAATAGVSEEPVWLDLVVVRELDAPAGAEPLEWRLLTNLPTTTTQELRDVVDSYRFRWRIEEFFRTKKDAMELEESRLETPDATARLLFFCTLKAMFLDHLRTAAGLASGVPPDDGQRLALKSLGRRAVELEKTRQGRRRPPTDAVDDSHRALMVLGLLARLGGWTNRRGAHLGNEILLRGLATLLHDLAHGHYDWLVSDLG